MENLFKHYEYSRKIDEVEIVDKARINYGITLGEWSVDQYIDDINNKSINQIVSDKIKDLREVDI